MEWPRAESAALHALLLGNRRPHLTRGNPAYFFGRVALVTVRLKYDTTGTVYCLCVPMSFPSLFVVRRHDIGAQILEPDCQSGFLAIASEIAQRFS